MSSPVRLGLPNLLPFPAVGRFVSAQALVCGTFVTRARWHFGSLAIVLGMSQRTCSCSGLGEARFQCWVTERAEQCGQPAVPILLLYKGLLLIFAPLKGHSSLSISVDIPPAHQAKDGFAWSSLCNMRVSPWCIITLIHIVSASDTALTQRQIPLLPNIVIVMYYLYHGKILRRQSGKN